VLAKFVIAIIFHNHIYVISEPNAVKPRFASEPYTLKNLDACIVIPNVMMIVSLAGTGVSYAKDPDVDGVPAVSITPILNVLVAFDTLHTTMVDITALVFAGVVYKVAHVAFAIVCPRILYATAICYIYD
jgi:hypothetical protein